MVFHTCWATCICRLAYHGTVNTGIKIWNLHSVFLYIENYRNSALKSSRAWTGARSIKAHTHLFSVACWWMSVVCLIKPSTCGTWIICVCVCVRVREREREPLIKEVKGIPMTGSCMEWRRIILMLLWVRACEYLHSSTSRITNGQTLVRYDPHRVYVLIVKHVTAGAFPHFWCPANTNLSYLCSFESVDSQGLVWNNVSFVFFVFFWVCFKLPPPHCCRFESVLISVLLVPSSSFPVASNGVWNHIRPHWEYLCSCGNSALIRTATQGWVVSGGWGGWGGGFPLNRISHAWRLRYTASIH